MTVAELVALFTAIGTPLVTAAGFVWRKIEARFKEIESELDKCRQGREIDQERRTTQVSVIEILWQEIMRLAPDSPALQRADKLMGDLKQKTRDVAAAENGE